MASNKYYLGDLITQRREKNPGGDLPIRGVSKEGLQPPKQIDADTSIYNLYYRNDFVYNPARMELGSIAFNDEYDQAICSSLYEVFYVHRTDLVIPEYLALFVKHPEFARYCNYIGNGSAREYCRFDDISGIPIYLPPISEQRKIVHDYQVIENRIELLRKMNENLESIIQALFEQMYSEAHLNINEVALKSIDLPENWMSTTIGKMCSVQTGPFGSQLHNEDYAETGVPIITVEHLNGKYIAHQNLPLVSDDDYCRLQKYDLHTGDIVFSRVGSVDRAVIVSKYEDSWLFSGRCLRVRPNVQDNAIYLLWWFNQPVVKQLVISSAVGTTMPSINTTILSNIKYVIPPTDQLSSFCNKAQVLIKKVWDNNAEMRALSLLKSHVFH